MRSGPVYLRFQGRVPNPGTQSKLGIFQLAFDLRDSSDTPEYAYLELRRNLDWLKLHLNSPDILDDRASLRAICWFKSAAREPLARIWPIKSVLEDFGYVVDVVKTRNPGQIIYEDGWQVVARPWRRQRHAL